MKWDIKIFLISTSSILLNSFFLKHFIAKLKVRCFNLSNLDSAYEKKHVIFVVLTLAYFTLYVGLGPSLSCEWHHAIHLLMSIQAASIVKAIVDSATENMDMKVSLLSADLDSLLYTSRSGIAECTSI